MLRLDESQIAEFYDQGYVVLPGVFLDAEIREIGEAFDRLRGTAEKLTRPQMIDGAYFVVNDHRIDRIVWCGAAEPILLKVGDDARLKCPAPAPVTPRSLIVWSLVICRSFPPRKQ